MDEKVMTYDELLSELEERSRQLREANEENNRLKYVVDAVKSLMDESEGVVGFHLNGEIATWDEVLGDVFDVNSNNTPDMKSLMDVSEEDSKTISRIRYDHSTRKLYVTFRSSGMTYIYLEVEQKVFEEFIQTKSKGLYFIDNIRGVYEYDIEPST